MDYENCKRHCIWDTSYWLSNIDIKVTHNPSKNEQEQANNNHFTFGLIFLTWYGASQTIAIYITFTYCEVAKPLRRGQLTFNHQTPSISLNSFDQLINLGRRKDCQPASCLFTWIYQKKVLLIKTLMFLYFWT